MSKLTVVAILVAKQGCEEPVRAELLNMIAPTRGESGCIEYKLLEHNDNPGTFVFYETWENLASFEAHKNTDHYISYVAAVKDMIEEKIVHKMTLIS